MLEPNERRALLQLARLAIAARLEGRPFDPPAAVGGLVRRIGAFVTLRHNNRLRGCLGSVEHDTPLVEVVARCAGDAATRDPRFPSLPLEELPEVLLEISVLGPAEPVADPADAAEFCMAVGSAAHPGRSARTELLVLAHGRIGGRPVSKVLLRPRSGRRHRARSTRSG